MKLDELVKMFDGASADQHTLEVGLEDIRAWHAEKERMRAALENVRIAEVGPKLFIGVIGDDGCWSAEVDGGKDIFLQWNAQRAAALSSGMGRTVTGADNADGS